MMGIINNRKMLFLVTFFSLQSICCFSKSTILISSLSSGKENTNTVFTGPQTALTSLLCSLSYPFLRAWCDFFVLITDTDSQWISTLASSYPGCLETLHLSFDSNKAMLAFQWLEKSLQPDIQVAFLVWRTFCPNEGSPGILSFENSVFGCGNQVIPVFTLILSS